MEDDPFGDVLDLEETYYQEGYALGVEDGSRTGRIEGRVFGLEKGFEKFAAMGLLHGKASVWASRMPQRKTILEKRVPASTESTEIVGEEKKETSQDNKLAEEAKGADPGLPSLPQNPRLAKHITTLHALTELPTFSTANTEDAVADFDDRFKRAGAKAKVIEKIVGEGDVDAAVNEQDDYHMTSSSSANTKEKERGVKLSRVEKPAENMEDFGGRREI